MNWADPEVYLKLVGLRWDWVISNEIEVQYHWMFTSVPVHRIEVRRMSIDLHLHESDPDPYVQGSVAAQAGFRAHGGDPV